jgi:hypothetical protein
MTPAYAPLLATLACIGSPPSDAAGVVVRLVDGRTVALASAAFGEDATILGAGESGQVSFHAADVLAVEFGGVREPPSNRQPAVLLADRQLLYGVVASADAESVVVQNAVAGPVRIPLSAVEGFLLTTGLGRRALADALDRIRATERGGDLLLLNNDDVLTGSIEQFGPEEWRIVAAGQTRSVPAKLVRGAALDLALLDYTPPAGLSARVRLSDGSVLAAASLLSTPDGLRVETAIGSPLVLKPNAVAGVAFRGGNALLLSDAAPLQIETRPFLDDVPRPRMDANLWGGGLSLGGVECDKGIGARGYTRIDYSAEGFSRFYAAVGVDDAADESASVVFRVLLDEKTAFESEEMTVAAPPKQVALELAGAKVISLVVDFGARGDVGDAAVWCEPRLVRR